MPGPGADTSARPMPATTRAVVAGPTETLVLDQCSMLSPPSFRRGIGASVRFKDDSRSTGSPAPGAWAAEWPLMWCRFHVVEVAFLAS